MKTIKKRLLSVLLVLGMLVGMMPMLSLEAAAVDLYVAYPIFPVDLNGCVWHAATAFNRHNNGSYSAVDINNWNREDDGLPVYAVEDGVVTQVLPSNGTVRIFHNSTLLTSNNYKFEGWTSNYCHMKGIKVKEGQKVHKNDPIGYIGSVGKAKGPHLHFGINSGNTVSQNKITDKNYCISPYYIKWTIIDSSIGHTGRLIWEVDDDDNPDAINNGKNPAGTEKLKEWVPSKTVGAQVLCTSHIWKDGICSKCGEWNRESFIIMDDYSMPPYINYINTIKESVLRTGPYAAVNNGIITVGNGTKLRVLQSGYNAIGRDHIWYKVFYNNREYYVYHENVSGLYCPVSNINIQIDNPVNNKQIKVGETCFISGSVSSSVGLKSIESIITSSTGEQISYKKLNISGEQYSFLRRGALDNETRFAKITNPDDYTLTIRVTDMNGTTQTATRTVKAVAPASVTQTQCSMPTITISDIVGGKRVTFTQQTSGATLHYAVNGTQSATSSSSVYIDITDDAYFTAYSSKSGMRDSGVKEYYTNVYKLSEPQININNTANGADVMIDCAEEASIYYSLDGNNYQPYWGPFSITNDATIYAYTSRNGYRNSDTAAKYVQMAAPEAPSVLLSTTARKLAQGAVVAMNWERVNNASGYTFNTYCNNELINSKELIDTSATFVLDSAGDYCFGICANNRYGNSTESVTETITSVSPLTVTFVDEDKEGNDCIILEQKVTYGSAATAPADPEKKGFDFLRWDSDYSSVTTDLTVRPVYKTKSYKVTFEDQTGKRIGNVQTITYGNPAQVPAESSLNYGNGYAFLGWNVQAESSDSECDLDAIDSDMTVKAIVGWKEAELPIALQITSAKRNDDSENGNYEVTVRINGTPEQYTTVLIRVSLKTAEGKLLKTEAHTVGIPAGTENKDELFTLNYSGTATLAETVVLGYNGDYATGSAYSEAVTAPITVVSEYTYGPWSDWNAAPAGSHDEVETLTQYRYKTKETISSYESSMPGWNWYYTNSYWVEGAWSAWDDAAYYATSSSTYKREVNTRPIYEKTQYQYSHYVNPNNGNTSPVQYSGWSGVHYCGNYAGQTWLDSQISDTGRKSNADGSPIYWGYCPTCGANKNFYNRTTQDIYRTQYQYKDSYLRNEYFYYRWSNYSDWQTSYIDSNDNREVETRVLYRYRDKNIPSYSALVGEEDNSGEFNHFNGTLPVSEDTDLEGKFATIMVYKGKNSDPNESQLEYVGQTVIGAGNTYNFSFKTKDQPSYETGDYVVSLGVQGSTGLINVDILKAPVKQHYVTFYDRDGNPIPVYYNGEKITADRVNESGEIIRETQLVNDGENAVLPEIPEVEGYFFKRWLKNTTNVMSDLEIMAEYEKKSYVYVYVDWINEKINIYEHKQSDFLATPEITEPEGYTFVNWEEDVDNGTENVRVFIAKYDVNEYNVSFMNYDGTEVLRTENLKYGMSANPPIAPEIDGMVFLGWNTNEAWWSVTADLVIYPIYIYGDTAMMPETTSETELYGEYGTLELDCEEDGTIYYTLDGSDPDADAEVYTGPIELVESTLVRAITIVPNKNSSDVLEVYFEYTDEPVSSDCATDLAEIGNYNVAIEPGKETTLQLKINENPGLVGYLFFIECDRSTFYVDYDEETGLAYTIGEASENGNLFCAPYEDKGWQVLWFSESASKNNGNLFSLTLKASEEATPGTYPIKVSYSPANTITNEEVEANVESINVLFSGDSNLKGDINGDGLITNIDVVRIARYVIDDITFSRKQLMAADVNGDGNITAADVIRLARYLVGLAQLV